MLPDRGAHSLRQALRRTRHKFATALSIASSVLQLCMPMLPVGSPLHITTMRFFGQAEAFAVPEVACVGLSNRL